MTADPASAMTASRSIRPRKRLGCYGWTAGSDVRQRPDRITGKSTAELWDRGDGSGAPRVTFAQPQVAAVGLTERAARDAGIEVQVVSVGTSANAGGMFWGAGAEGTSQLVIDARRRG